MVKKIYKDAGGAEDEGDKEGETVDAEFKDKDEGSDDKKDKKE